MSAGRPLVAVAGEVLTDLVPLSEPATFRAAAGGSPGNVAVGLARLEVPVRMLARLSADPLGRRLRAHLEVNGVDLSHAVEAGEPSSLAIVTNAPDGSASYHFRVDGTCDWQWTDGELTDVLDDVVALHVGSLALTTPPGHAALRRLAARAGETATVSYDPNVRPDLMGTPDEVRIGVDAMLGVADVVKASADDLAWLEPSRPALEVAADWLARGPALVFVTLGGEGAVALGPSGDVRCAGRSVAVVDTVGAGDSFMSALLAGLYRRDLLGAARRSELGRLDRADLGALVDEAVRASALTCARAGADPPTLTALRAARRTSRAAQAEEF